MDEKECKNVTEQLTDPKNLTEAGKKHIKVCKKCATTVSLLLTLKAGPTPTAGLVPSPTFVNSVLAGIGIKSAVASSAATSTATATSKTVVTVAVALGLATAVGLGLTLGTDDSFNNILKNQKSESAKRNIIEIELLELEALKNIKSPVLKFDSPANETK
ncbi:MAG: hypothetical protein PHF29_08695 [Candidatus Riflebacteria bacterium]|nr:hypothetical protein [Candidatus Riflebacteria bacterium]